VSFLNQPLIILPRSVRTCYLTIPIQDVSRKNYPSISFLQDNFFWEKTLYVLFIKKKLYQNLSCKLAIKITHQNSDQSRIFFSLEFNFSAEFLLLLGLLIKRRNKSQGLISQMLVLGYFFSKMFTGVVMMALAVNHS